MKEKIYGYFFRIIVEKVESGYVAYCPGVGGVYEEGITAEEAETNAYEAARAILATRWEAGDLLTEENPYLRILRKPPAMQYIADFQKEDAISLAIRSFRNPLIM